MNFPIGTKVNFINSPNNWGIVDGFDICDFENSRKVSVSGHWFHEDELFINK